MFISSNLGRLRILLQIYIFDTLPLINETRASSLTFFAKVSQDGDIYVYVCKCVLLKRK